MDNNNKSYLEKIAIIAPITFAFLSFCGFLYAQVYYNVFKIHIVSYMDVSEMLLNFLRRSDELLYFALGLSLICFLIRFLEKRNEKRNKVIVILGFTICLILLIILIIFSWQYTIHFSKVFYYISKSFFSVIIGLCCLIFVSEVIIADVNSIKIQATSVIIVFVASSYWFAIDDIDNRIIDKSSALIQMENKTIICNNNRWYIGQTNRFIFLYNMIGDSTEIFPIGSIKKITIK